MYEKLREIRNTMGISAKFMAEALGLKTEAAYYKKESGMTKFTLREARIISKIIGKPIETIFFDQNVSLEETSDIRPTGTE